MSATQTFEPPPGFVDPRSEPGFVAEHWPLCNGLDLPPAGRCDPHERRCLEFLAFYYRLNLLNNRLLAARSTGAADEVIRPLLEQIRAVTGELETAEDRYTPIGFFPDPVMDGIQYRDIQFVRPEMPRFYSQASPQSSCIAIPGLDEIPASELCGPARVLRFGHGKVDL